MVRKRVGFDYLLILFFVVFVVMVFSLNAFSGILFGPSDERHYVCDVTALNGATCFGDVDGNGFITIAERAFVSANIGKTDRDLVCLYDLDGNGAINSADRAYISVNLGRCMSLPDYQDGSGLNRGSLDSRFPWRCGDNFIDYEFGEVCDGTDLDEQTCSSVSSELPEGVLGCLTDCSGFDVSQCSPGSVGICGNNIVEGSEVCDGTDLAFASCMDFGFVGGSLNCNLQCNGYDASQCIGVVEPVCGNNILEDGEQCDDGNSENGDGCTNQCVNEIVAPLGLIATNSFADGAPVCNLVRLRWDKVEDESNLQSYKIYRDGLYLSESTAFNCPGCHPTYRYFADSAALLGSADYLYEVSAQYFSGEESSRAQVQTTTPSCLLSGHLNGLDLNIILLKFADFQEQPFEPEYARDIFFDNSFSLKNYFEEISYGSQEIAGDVSGWYQLSGNASDYCQLNSQGYGALSTCSVNVIRTEAERLIGQSLAGDNKRLVMVINGANGGSAGGEIIAIGATDSSGGLSNINFATHEIGHTLRAKHAGSWGCNYPYNNVAGSSVDDVSQDCVPAVYGDSYDIMGVDIRHTNSLHKEIMGYLAPSQVRSALSEGEYVLDVLETPSSGVKELRIPLFGRGAQSEKTFYFLEYRKPIGFDSIGPTNSPEYVLSPSFDVIEGVYIRLHSNFGFFDADTFWIKKILREDSSSTQEDESVFCDPYRNIEIEFLEFLPDDKVRISVDYDSDCEQV